MSRKKRTRCTEFLKKLNKKKTGPRCAAVKFDLFFFFFGLLKEMLNKMLNKTFNTQKALWWYRTQRFRARRFKQSSEQTETWDMRVSWWPAAPWTATHFPAAASAAVCSESSLSLQDAPCLTRWVLSQQGPISREQSLQWKLHLHAGSNGASEPGERVNRDKLIKTLSISFVEWRQFLRLQGK